MSRLVPSLLLALSALPAGAAVFGDSAPTQPVPPREGREVQDLHYGDSLFHYYQDDYFGAIVRLTAAQKMGRAGAHADDAELVLGGMLLSYGQHRQAAAIFKRLLDGGAKPEVRDLTWFYLARAAFDRGDAEQAQDAIARIASKLKDPQLEDERRMLAAQVLIALQRYPEAAAQLADWKGAEDWRTYARFNRGIALLKAGNTAEALQTLDQAGKPAARGEEAMTVRDRANVALGYAAIQAGQPELARTALQRVRLEGGYSNPALLGLGWAESALGRNQEALVPWMELQQRDLSDPSVQESRLALPYAMTALKAYGRAAKQYQIAIDGFDAEVARLDQSIARVRSGQLIADLIRDETSAGLGGNWPLRKLPAEAKAEARSLLPLLSSRNFQQGLKNYRDLRFLSRNLGERGRDIVAFTDLLETQKLAYARRAGRVQAMLERADLGALAARRAALAQSLATFEKDSDAVGLADAKESARWQRLQSVQQRLDRLGSRAPGDVADQARLLRGVLLWKLSSQFPERLWRAKRELAQIDAQLAIAGERRATLDRAYGGEPARLASIGRGIAGKAERISALQARTDALLQRQQSALQELAVDELQDYQQRLRGYAAEARFALAQVYDRAAGGSPAP